MGHNQPLHHIHRQIWVGAVQEGGEVGGIAHQIVGGRFLACRVICANSQAVVYKEADVLTPQGQESVARTFAVDRADGGCQVLRVGVQAARGGLELNRAGVDGGHGCFRQQIGVLTQQGVQASP